MPENQQPTHFAIVTAQSGPRVTTWTASLTFSPDYTRSQAFDRVMTEFVRTNPSMASHVILFFDLQRDGV